MFSITDIFKLIPDSLKQSAVDAIVETVVERGEGLISDSILNKIKGLRSDAAFRQQLDAGLQRGLQRFVDEYQLQDEDLVTAVAQDPTLFTTPAIRTALLTIVQQPGRYLVEEQTLVGQSFAAILPERINRERVDRAILYLLKCLAQELWQLPELQPIYSLEFQRITAESTREQLTVQKAQLAALQNLNSGVREALLQLTDALSEQKQLAVGLATDTLPAPRPAVYHNLPQPDYGEFIGREKEFHQIFDLLRPYPQSRHHLIVIDGIGGIGKSALALEVAHRCLHASLEAARSERTEQDHLTRLRQILLDRFDEEELRTLCFDLALDYDMLPGRGKEGKARELLAYLERRNRLSELIELIQGDRPDIQDTDLLSNSKPYSFQAQQFDAIIWTSAKNNILTADGIVARRQVLKTLDDIYTAVSIALQRDDIIRASSEQQNELVRRTLAQQRTLLIIDNLETVDDENVVTFLRELPDPTKAIVTTRHRIDVAYPIRLGDMPWIDAHKLISNQANEKQVVISNEQAQNLYAHTGGVPLAITWSIAQMGFGYSVDTVLKRLNKPQEDIARFCFEESLSLIQQHPAYNLLLALSLFETGATRQALGQVSGYEDDILIRDEALVHLEKLSLISRENDRFRMLPLTREYTKAQMTTRLKQEHDLRVSLEKFYLLFLNEQRKYESLDAVKEEVENILSVMDWAIESGRINVFLNFVISMDFYYWALGRWNAWRKHVELGMIYAVSTSDLELEARLLRTIAYLEDHAGNYSEAEAAITKAIGLYELLGDQKEAIDCQSRLGSIQLNSNQYQAAKTNLNDALIKAERIRIPRIIVRILRRLAQLDLINGDLEQAESKLNRAIDLRISVSKTASFDQENRPSQPINDTWSQRLPISSTLTHVYRLLGEVALERNDFDKATTYFEFCIDICHRSQNQMNLAQVYLSQAKFYQRKENRPEARNLALQARGIFHEYGATPDVEKCNILLLTLADDPE